MVNMSYRKMKPCQTLQKESTQRKGEGANYFVKLQEIQTSKERPSLSLSLSLSLS
jgi:hypothetical protein